MLVCELQPKSELAFLSVPISFVLIAMIVTFARNQRQSRREPKSRKVRYRYAHNFTGSYSHPDVFNRKIVIWVG